MKEFLTGSECSKYMEAHYEITEALGRGPADVLCEQRDIIAATILQGHIIAKAIEEKGRRPDCGPM